MIIKPPYGVQLNRSHSLGRDVVSAWLFNDLPQVAGITHDLSGNGNHGTFTGDAHSVAGKFGAALNLGGTGYVEIGADARYGGSVYFISFWINPDSVTSSQYIMDNRANGNGNDRAIIVGFQSGYFNFYDGDYPTGSANDTRFVATAGVWQHVVMGTDGTSVFAYLNGVKVIEQTGTWLVNDIHQAFIIGGRANSPPINLFTGQIDDVQIYNRVLAVSEIMELNRDPFQMFERSSIELWSAASQDVGGVFVNGSATGSCEFTATAAAHNYNLASASGDIEFTATVAAHNYNLASAAGDIEFIGTSAGRIFCFASVTGSCEFTATAQAGIGIQLMPPEMHESIVDPYAGGAWMWLIRINIPGYIPLWYARNTENVLYGGKNYIKNNFNIGLATSSGDGSVPRSGLVIAQDADYTLEDEINATQGASGGMVKVIRAHEDYLDKFILELEQEVQILVGNSDADNITFHLGMPNPLLRKIPLRRYSSKRCPYALPSLFKGPECQYAGANVTCTGLYEDCFTKNNIAFWGGEAGLDPAVARV